MLTPDLFTSTSTDRMGIGGHQRASGGTDEWLTPPELLEAIGPFDLDPCAPITRPWPTAGRHFTLEGDGLRQPWEGRVWCNPPYSTHARWLARLAEHGQGTALLFARTETSSFHEQVWAKATGLLFLRGRLHFHHPDGRRARANSGAPSVLVAYGEADAMVLARRPWPGEFIYLGRRA